MTLDILFSLILLLLVISVFFCMKYKNELVLKLKNDHSNIYEKIGPVDQLDNNQIRKEQELRKLIRDKKYLSLNDPKLNRMVDLYHFYGYFMVSCVIFLIFVTFIINRNGDTPAILNWLNQAK